MVIETDARNGELSDLLFVRTFYGLDTDGPPRPLPGFDEAFCDTPRLTTNITPTTWLTWWGEALARLEPEPDGDPSSPTWRQQLGLDAFRTDSFDQWQRTLAAYSPTGRQAGGGPLRLSLDALITAWRAGLQKLIVIPCSGSYNRVIDPRTLLLTHETHTSIDRFENALKEFIASVER